MTSLSDELNFHRAMTMLPSPSVWLVHASSKRCGVVAITPTPSTSTYRLLCMAAVGGFFVVLMTQQINPKPRKSASRVNNQPPPAYLFEVARALARMLAREDHKQKNKVLTK